MLGLLVKDFKLLKMQKKFLIIMLVLIGVFMMVGYDASFLISYPTFLCSFLIISTISYDDFNHGTTFLLTLPVTRKGYIQEKYALSLIFTLGVWIVSTFVCTIYQMYTVNDFEILSWFLTCGLLLCIPLFFLAVTLPIQFKYGAEKGRIAMVVTMGAAAAGIFILVKALSRFEIDFIGTLNSLSGIQVISGGIIIVFITLLISYIVSVKIMQKKEF